MEENPAAGLQTADCWQKIGVWGDVSCPELDQFVHCKNCPVFMKAGRSLLEREAPADYLEEWKDVLARPKEASPAGLISVVIFRIADNCFALDTKSFREVTELRPVHKLPHRTRNLLRGIVNIRGELQLCFSMAQLLGMENETPAANGRMIVIEQDNTRWVFAVDQVYGTDAVIPPPSQSSLQTQFFWQSRKVALLHSELLFEELRRRAL